MIALIYIWFSLVMAFAGALLYRARGGKPDIPRPIEQMAFCSIGYVALLSCEIDFIISTVAYIVAVIVCLKGHGQYFLARNVKFIRPEWVDWMITPIFGKDPRCNEKYKYMEDSISESYLQQRTELIKDLEFYGMDKLKNRCFFGLALTGGFVGLPFIVAFMISGYPIFASISLIIALFIIKPLAYNISYENGYDTEGGEFGFGGLFWLLFAPLILIGIGLY